MPNLGCSQLPAAAAIATVDTSPDISPSDRVFITNEYSNTISVIDPAKNAVDTTVNLTSLNASSLPAWRLSERRSEAILREMSEEDDRAMAQEYPDLFTPEVLENEQARWRKVHASRALTLSRSARIAVRSP